VISRIPATSSPSIYLICFELWSCEPVLQFYCDVWWFWKQTQTLHGHSLS